MDIHPKQPHSFRSPPWHSTSQSQHRGDERAIVNHRLPATRPCDAHTSPILRNCGEHETSVIPQMSGGSFQWTSSRNNCVFVRVPRPQQVRHRLRPSRPTVPPSLDMQCCQPIPSFGSPFRATAEPKRCHMTPQMSGGHLYSPLYRILAKFEFS